MNHLTSEQLTDFVHGELTPASDAAAHAHLADCGLCRAEYDAEIALGEALRSAATADEREFPSIVKAVVWERVREMPTSRVLWLSNWMRPLVALPVAAALVLGVWFASPIGQRPAHMVDAAYYLEAHAAQTNGSPLSEPSTASTLETSMIDTSGAAPATLAEAVDAVR